MTSSCKVDHIIYKFEYDNDMDELRLGPGDVTFYHPQDDVPKTKVKLVVPMWELPLNIATKAKLKRKQFYI